uniref:Choline transporter-like protein n=1 Tax=Hyaloperonospora arabidopsidis (strain Emoy2) TaxID=559515 RepID=M4BM22_HYAAE
MNVWYIYAVQNRIGFASANLKAACAGLKQHTAVFVLAFTLVVQQLMWILLWGIACVGLHQLFLENDPNCDRELQLASRGYSRGGLCVGLPAYTALFYMLVSVYWGQQILQNILTCTTAGVIATWWYQPEAEKATLGALYRSVTTSFGSICFGSLIVAVLQALRTMADMAKRRASEENNGGLACLACMAECILSCLAGVMEYFNQWAYVYVGVYGYPFRASGKAVMDLFKTRGWTAIINDDLTSGALSFGALGVGVVTCCVGLLMVRFSPVEWFTALGSSTSVYATMAIVGFMVGISVAMTLAHVVIAALHTVFVCFAEDPVALNRNHPEEYEDLVAGWRQFHGNASCGSLVMYCCISRETRGTSAVTDGPSTSRRR